jgi:hypothetical protein
MAAVRSRGSLIAQALRCEDGQTRGWFIYYLQRGGLAELIHIAAERTWTSEVVDELIDDARRRLAAGLRGRIEPGLLEPLSTRGCFFRYDGGALIHSRDPKLLRTVLAGEALLTRMDGAWWTGHHLETFR